MGLELLSPVGVPVTPRDYDVRVDDDQPTLQAADDAQGDRPYTMVVRDGTYAGDLTVDSDCVYIFFEPASDLDGTITISGDNVALVIGGGSGLEELVTLSGASDSIRCLNGVDFDGILASGDFGFVDGGGWGTLSNGMTLQHGLLVTGNDAIVHGISAQTTAGGGTGLDGFRASGDRCNLLICRVAQSDSDGFNLGQDAKAIGCVIMGADRLGVQIVGPRTIIVGLYVQTTSTNNGVNYGATGDDSVLVGSVVRDPGANSVNITADAENCVVAGNRLDGAVNDLSGTATVGDNLTTAF